MASKLETDVLLLTEGDPRRLREAIQRAHDDGHPIAAPHDPLMAVFDRVLDSPTGNIISAAQEVVRAHAQAFGLSGEDLDDTWQFFIGYIETSYC